LLAGEIIDLVRQPKFVFHVGPLNIKICEYIADFQYFEIATGETVVEDVKSPATRKEKSYRIKKKLFDALFPELDHREA